MKTSYFGRLRSLDLSRYYLVQVCVHPPNGVTCDVVLSPALPDWQQLVRPYKDGLIDEEEYEVRYLRQLNGNRERILAGIREVIREAGDREPLLLCFEKPSDWCHRHILAGWLQKEGFDISEL